MEPIETEEFEFGITGEIHYDEDPWNPREECDNLGTMICFHNRYRLGDEHHYEDPQQALRRLAEEVDPTVSDRIWYWEDGPGYVKIDNFYTANPEATSPCPRSKASDPTYIKIGEAVESRVQRLVQKVLERHYIMADLYLMDHGQISISTGSFNDPWDSGQVGFIFISIAKAKSEYGWKVLTNARRKRIQTYLEGEVETYDQYLTGQVFGYEVKDAEGDVLESCWGFYGEEYCLEEMRAAASHCVVEASEEVANQTEEEVYA